MRETEGNFCFSSVLMRNMAECPFIRIRLCLVSKHTDAIQMSLRLKGHCFKEEVLIGANSVLPFELRYP